MRYFVYFSVLWDERGGKEMDGASGDFWVKNVDCVDIYLNHSG